MNSVVILVSTPVSVLVVAHLAMQVGTAHLLAHFPYLAQKVNTPWLAQQVAPLALMVTIAKLTEHLKYAHLATSAMPHKNTAKL